MLIVGGNIAGYTRTMTTAIARNPWISGRRDVVRSFSARVESLLCGPVAVRMHMLRMSWRADGKPKRPAVDRRRAGCRGSVVVTGLPSSLPARQQQRDTSRLLFRTTCSILKGDAEAKDAGSGTPISTRGVCCERSVARVPARTHADGFAAGGG